MSSSRFYGNVVRQQSGNWWLCRNYRGGKRTSKAGVDRGVDLGEAIHKGNA